MSAWRDFTVMLDDAGSSLPYSTVYVRALSRADALWRIEHRTSHDVDRVVSIDGERASDIRKRVSAGRFGEHR